MCISQKKEFNCADFILSVTAVVVFEAKGRRIYNMAERVPLASELSRIMERVACEVTRHVGQLELRPVLDENPPAETVMVSEPMLIFAFG